MAPFLLGNVVLVARLGKRLANTPQWAWALVPIVFFDPVMAGQQALISPDTLVVCGFLMAVEGVFSKHKMLLAFGILLLCASSMRGMMTAAALFVWCLALRHPFLRTHLPATDPTRRALVGFLPGFAFAAWFLWWHHWATGWTGFHSGSPWAQAFERTNPAGFVKNTAIVCWRFLDFGRVFEWLVLVALLWKTPLGKVFWFKKKGDRAAPLPPHPATLLVLCCCLAVFLLPSSLIYQNLSAHRYFLPLFIVLHLIVFQLLTTKRKSFCLGLVLLGLLSGNCWIYPRGISMDWDSTLAHRPYHALRAEAVHWLTARGIAFSTVGSAFPNLNTGENLLLNGDERRFSDKDFAKNSYIFTSNIFNDFSESDYAQLEKEWRVAKRFEKNGVWIEIYEKP